jgi:hypothetical protein
VSLLSACDDDAPALWRVLAVALIPLVVGEACLAVREYVRREHKARLRRDRQDES